MSRKDIKNIKLFLLDMDGTIYLDEQLFDGVTEFLKCIKERGGRYVFLTNNSSKGADKYVEKLARLGIQSSAEDFLTSVDATAVRLKADRYKKIYVFGTESFKRQLNDSGLVITDKIEDDIDCLCMGFDTELTFKKLEDACILLNRGVEWIATNPDWVCPTWYGYVPDCGSVSEMLTRATGRKPTFIGKPQPEMPRLAMEKFGFKPSETAVVGDRLYTDIACGKNAGIGSVFVLSGEGTLKDIDKYGVNPDFIYDTINDLYMEYKS